MKLTAMQIHEALGETGIKLEKLHEKLIKHWGFGQLHYSQTYSAVTEGVSGLLASHIAYELGLPTPWGYVPLFGPEGTNYLSIDGSKTEVHKVPENNRLPVGINHNGRKYCVCLGHKNKKHYGGNHDTLKEALNARDKLAKKIGKRFTKRSINQEYIGVYRRRGIDKFFARIAIDGRTKHLGSYDCKHQAALAYNKAAEPLGRRLNEVVF